MHDDKQLDPAEEAASRAIDLIPGKDKQFPIRQSHRTLGGIYQSKGETEKAVHYLEVALELLPPPTGTMSYFGFIIPRRGCSSSKAGLTVHRLILDTLNPARPIAHTTWVVQWSRRLGSGTGSTGLGKRGPRLCTLGMFCGLGLRKRVSRILTALDRKASAQ